jgi:hypothetical protein
MKAVLNRKFSRINKQEAKEVGGIPQQFGGLMFNELFSE